MVDVHAQVNAVDRTVGSGELEGAPTRVQKLSQTYPSPLEDVWDAVTSAERIPRWFLPIEGDLRLGGRYQLVGNAGGEVLECAPPQGDTAHYRVTWEFGGGVSWVEVALQRVDEESTRLDLIHTAKEADLPPGFWEIYGPGATGVGWDGGLLGLALHLAGNSDLPPEAAEAWASTDEGRAFYRAAADAWGAAQIAGGGDPDAATAAADATYGFYTGQAEGGMPDA